MEGRVTGCRTTVQGSGRGSDGSNQGFWASKAKDHLKSLGHYMVKG